MNIIRYFKALRKKYEDVNFNNIQVYLNPNLECYGPLKDGLKLMKIQICEINPEGRTFKPPSEMNMLVGRQVSPKAIYLLAMITIWVSIENVHLYINYAPDEVFDDNSVYIGSYLKQNTAYTNVSRATSVKKLVALRFQNLTLEEFSALLPNENYYQGVGITELDEFRREIHGY